MTGRLLALAAALAVASGVTIAKIPVPEMTPEQKTKAEEAKAKAAEAAKKAAEDLARAEDMVAEKYKKSLAAKQATAAKK
jgi:predicted aconitase